MIAAGQELRDLRLDAGLSVRMLAGRAELSEWAIGAIEHAARRTRRSTLERIGRALDEPHLADHLTAILGPALAPESPWAARMERRRARRRRQAEREREQVRRWDEAARRRQR